MLSQGNEMNFTDFLQSIIQQVPDERTLWDGRYKIPWDDPDFSRRMLKEHLSQDHDLASRNQKMIMSQVKWIHEQICHASPARLLDIGCGPGLYVEQFVQIGYECCGIDFSPASIEYAQSRLSNEARFVEGDIRVVDFPTDNDLAMMVFGELNVFSPDECRRILKKAYSVLVNSGKLLLEVHTFDSIQRLGNAPSSWYKSGAGLTGLFSDQPHICLIENHWIDTQQTALQKFHIIDAASGDVESYRSTTKAWTDDEYRELLSEAGFADVTVYPDWPVHSDDLMLFSAGKL